MARSRKRYRICRAVFPSIQENGMALWCLMKITPQLFEAFLKCPTKCWLKSTGEHGVGNEYAEWVEGQNEAYRGPDYPSALWAGPAPSLQRARNEILVINAAGANAYHIAKLVVWNCPLCRCAHIDDEVWGFTRKRSHASLGRLHIAAAYKLRSLPEQACYW